MKRLALLLLLFAIPAQAADNFDVTAGTGTTIATKNVTGVVHIPKHTLVDQTGADLSGAKADAKSTATDTTAISYMSVYKQISASVQAIATALADSPLGSAPPTQGNYIAGNGSGATGGLLQGVKICDLHAFYTGTDTGSKTLVAGVSGRKTYICSFLLSTGTTGATLTLYKGTDADCATSGAAIGPPYALLVNERVGIASSFWNGFVTATNADYVCINSSAAVQHTAEILYTIQ